MKFLYKCQNKNGITNEDFHTNILVTYFVYKDLDL